MPTPSFVTSQNLKFNGTTSNAVVLRDAGGVKSVVEWDVLSLDEQNTLTSFVNANGGGAPLASPTSGKQTLDFGGSVVTTGNTILDGIATATAGYAVIDLNGDATPSGASGLSTLSGTNGYQVINYQPGITSTTSTGIPAATAGYQIAHFSVPKTVGVATGIPNDATVRSAVITVDGVAKTVSAAGSGLQTFTALLSAINSALGSAGSAALVNGDIKVTSATTGTSSSVTMVTGTIFGAITDFSVIQASVAGTGSTVNLTATVTIDGVAKNVSVAPGSVATFGAVITALNGALGAAGSAALVGGDIKITSASFGVSSKVVVSVGTLFPALSGFVGALPAATGGGAARKYSMVVTVDNSTIKTVTFSGVQGNTYQHVVDEINADLGAVATAALVNGDIVITSASTGVHSSVTVQDTGFLVNSLTYQRGVRSVAGTDQVTYGMTVVVDGTTKVVSLAGSDAPTFATLLIAINNDISPAATATIAGGNIVITSASTGVGSSVEVTDGNLLRSVAGFKQLTTSVRGAADLLDAMHVSKTASGAPLSSVFKVETIRSKPPVPANVKHTLAFAYHDGTKWRYLDDDTQV